MKTIWHFLLKSSPLTLPCSFEMNNGVEVDDDVPFDLLKIPGKKKYFLQANSVIINKLVDFNKARIRRNTRSMRSSLACL